MPNLTLAIPYELHEKMREHSEIRWSEVVRKTISEKIEDLEMLDKLTNKSKMTPKDVEMISAKIDSDVARKLSQRFK